jgi:serine/threonine-protein kinase RsbW
VRAEPLSFLASECFPGVATAVGLCREFVRSVLGDGWPGLDDVLLMVSEVASNAVRHTASGGSWFDVSVSGASETVRVCISDRGSSSEPRMRDDLAGDDVLTGGRGLRIVDALADKWGHAGDELGRTVWFEVTGKRDD